MKNLNKLAKSITALVTGVIGWGLVVVASDPQPITASEWMQLAIAVAIGFGVYAVPNAK